MEGLFFRVEMVSTQSEIAVYPFAEGIDLDRRRLTGFVMSFRKRKLAERLKLAIEAGVVFADPRVSTDVNGRTYLACTSMVHGKTANADLKRLGF